MATDETTGEPRAELFRPAAVAAHRAGATVGGEIPSSHRLTSGAYWALLAGIAAAVFAAFTIHVEETSAGVWAAGPKPGTALVALPIGALARLAPGQRIGLRKADSSTVVETLITAVLNPEPIETASTQFSFLPDALRSATAVSIVQVAVPPTMTGHGGATAHLARRSLASELVPGLRNETSRGG